MHVHEYIYTIIARVVTPQAKADNTLSADKDQSQVDIISYHHIPLHHSGSQGKLKEIEGRRCSVVLLSSSICLSLTYGT